MAGSGSGLYVKGVLSHSSWDPSFRRGTKRARTNRSIFNSTDDWDELVAFSTLSTASVSTRPARPRGLQTLAVCAEHCAVRNFKRLYEEGKVRNEHGLTGKGWWEVEWEIVPDHLKLKVRDGVYRRYGSMLKMDVIRDLFMISPELHYPGDLIPALASTSSIKTLHPPAEIASSITSLNLRHCPQMTDAAIASLIHHLPNLEYLNLKECTLAGSQTAKAIMKRCANIRGLNLKGTKIGEVDVTALLGKYGDRLERLKVDNLTCQNPDAVFTSSSYPHLTHLCIPGDLINATEQSFRARARQSGHTIAHPTPRPSRPDAAFDWPYFAQILPALTHLYLPGLLIPPSTTIRLVPKQLVKLSLGFGGPPVPVGTLTQLIISQSASLRLLHIGHLLPDRSPARDFENLGQALFECAGIQDFRFASDAGGSKDNKCDQAMQRFSDLVYQEALSGPWRASLKHLHLSLPQKISADAFSRESIDTVIPPLEHLSLPSAEIRSTSDLAVNLSAFRNLRNLDLSGTSITTDEVYTILDSCLMLSRIDLTTCRGVGVRLRRGIFEAWAEDREEKRREAAGEVEPENTGRRPKRRRG